MPYGRDVETSPPPADVMLSVWLTACEVLPPGHGLSGAEQGPSLSSWVPGPKLDPTDGAEPPLRCPRLLLLAARR